MGGCDDEAGTRSFAAKDPLTKESVVSHEAIKGMSLERKLPLLMTGVLIAILLAGVLLSYREVRLAGDLVITHRVQEVTQQVASLTSASRPRLAERLRAIADNPAVLRALTTRPPAGRDIPPIKNALSNLATPADSNVISELWASDGRVIARVGGPNSQGDRPTTGAIATGPDSMSMG